MIDLTHMKRLPRWAQDEIQRLAADASEWRSKALAATGGAQKKTDCYLTDHLDEIGLPPASTVRYYIGKRGERDRRAAVEPERASTR